ncbi:hypothetical protein L2E82_36296 [Cichorium intybus]|uniref:Uncharacterized protein n=1 Tax=Cichorium intybus TaxID=13427 RepID=A0ACB9BRC1_CICIN|nr:hypothetical protein L2E82_36296 [Cichorium intybus]
MPAALSPPPSPAPLASLIPLPRIHALINYIRNLRINGAGTADSSIGIGEETGSLLERAEVFDLNGKSILISDLWKDRKAIVAFSRHFGYVLYRKRDDMLAAKKDRMDTSSVALVLIGPGSVDQARAFSSKQVSRRYVFKH